MGLLSTHIFKKICVFSTFQFYSRRFVEILHFPSFAALFSCGNSRTAVSILALSVTYGDTSPKGRGLGKEMNFAWTAKGSHSGGAGALAPERASLFV